jgi:hypothetical protein
MKWERKSRSRIRDELLCFQVSSKRSWVSRESGENAYLNDFVRQRKLCGGQDGDVYNTYLALGIGNWKGEGGVCWGG